MRLIVAFLLLLTLSTVSGKLYSIYKEDALNSNWLLGSEELELATSSTGIFSNVNLPNSSIIALNLDSINIKALKVVSHASEIHFDFATVSQMTLKLGNSTHFLQYGNDNKTFDFGGFSRALFKGKCPKWIINFSDIFSQENHTVTVGEKVQDNMISIESKNGLFEAIFLEVSSELHIYGGDANETFEIRDLQSSFNHEEAAKLKIFGGNGHDSAIFFPVTYGAYVCPINVNTDTILVTDSVICTGTMDSIQLVAGTITIASNGRLQTNTGPISLHYNQVPSAGNIYGQIITNGNFNCDLGSLLIQDSNIYATSTHIEYSGPAYATSYVRVRYTILDGTSIRIVGAVDSGQAVLLEFVSIVDCYYLEITVTGDATFQNSFGFPLVDVSITVYGTTSTVTMQDCVIDVDGYFSYISPGGLSLTDTRITGALSVFVRADRQLDFQGSSYVYAFDTGALTIIANVFNFIDFYHPSKTGGTIEITGFLNGNSLRFGTGFYAVIIHGDFKLLSYFSL